MKNKILTLFVLLFYSAITTSQTDSTLVYKKIPSLNEHSFPSTVFLRNSFINTNLSTNIGFGTTDPISVPEFTIGDVVIPAFEGNILFVDLNIQYQQKITHWLAAYLGAKFTARVGTDMYTVLYDGANTITGSNIGLLMKIKQTNKFNLSGSIGYNKVSGNFIGLADFIEDIIEGEADSTIFNTNAVSNVNFGIRGAYAFNSMYGVQFNTEYGYGESLGENENESYYAVGAVGDIDFYPRYKVPVDLALGYSISSSPEIVMADGGTSNLYFGKIAYSASNDYELGLQFIYYNIDINSLEQKPYIKKIMLGLKFYF